MPRKALRPGAAPPVSARRPVSPVFGYLLTAVVAAALGAGLTWLRVHPRPHAAPPPAPSLAASLPPDAARILSYWYESQKNWPQAIALMQRAISGGEDNANNRTDLGVDYFQAGQYQQALAQYQIAQRQDPHHENSLFNEGSAYAQLGQFSQAIDTWNAYLQRFPHGQHVADAHALIARMHNHPAQTTSQQ